MTNGNWFSGDDWGGESHVPSLKCRRLVNNTQKSSSATSQKLNCVAYAAVIHRFVHKQTEKFLHDFGVDHIHFNALRLLK